MNLSAQGHVDNKKYVTIMELRAHKYRLYKGESNLKVVFVSIIREIPVH